MRRHSTRAQRTIRQAAEVVGFGFLTGAEVRLRFVPAPAGAGVTFVRLDLPGKPRLAAHVSHVTDTSRRTTLGRSPVQVTLVEHVMAALAGARIDNCMVELNAIEPPGLDGSSLGFVEALAKAGVETQRAPRFGYAVDAPVTVIAGNATLTLHPPKEGSTGLTLSYFLDYGPRSPIARQVYTCELTPMTFAQDVASARTFLLKAEALELRRNGLGANTTAADLIVFGPEGPIDNALRHANEPARHKVLDMVGDLSLLGADLCGHAIACRSGHPLNAELTRTLATQLSAFSGQQSVKCA